MKTVFSNEQCAHVWAQQVQPKGRGSSVFFEDNKFYSYGYHYLAAMIHEVKGKRFALVRSDTYSNTTSKHLWQCKDAVRGLMPYFCATDVVNPKKASLELDADAKQWLLIGLKKSKVTSKEEIKRHFENVRDQYGNANQLRKLIGKSEIWPSKRDLDKVEAHLNARLKRYKELNTPEMLAKREAKALERKEKEHRAQLALNAKKIEAFRRGENVHLYELPFELLRVKGDNILTSRGAEVPLSDARRLYMALKNGLDVKGKTIGQFTVIGVYTHRNLDLTETKVVQIGCHKILLTEAERVLGAA